MVDVDYYNLDYLSSPCSIKQIKNVVLLASQKEKKIRGLVTLSIVGEKKMRSLNRQYRKHNKVTDVLSFPFEEGKQFITPDNAKLLGEIFICPSHIQKQARIFKVSYQNEFVRMLVHGLLHLAGHDHMKAQEAEKMFVIQEKIVCEVYKKIFKKPLKSYPINLLKLRHEVYLV